MLAETRAALATALSQGTSFQVSAYQLANPTPPAAHVFPASTEYDAVMARGGDWWVFTLQVFVSDNAGDIGQQKALDAMIEPSGSASVKALIEANKTLGGVVNDAHVVSFDGYRVFQTEGRGPVLGGEWTIRVLT